MKTEQGPLCDAPAAPVGWDAPEAGEPPGIDARVQTPWDTGDTFRRALVELMLTVVEAWERSTGRNRLDLAEQSRIWRVTVDDGRLRARAMERYLSLAKLPRHPRWREVLRSAYYVLGECAPDRRVRAELQQRVDAVLGHVWKQALTVDALARRAEA